MFIDFLGYKLISKRIDRERHNSGKLCRSRSIRLF